MCHKRLLAGAVFALACLGASTGFAQEGGCNPQVPMPPDPLPPDFDWTPLALDWCAQLDDCGFNTANCVNDYLAAIGGGVPPAGSMPPEGTDEAFAGVTLGCEDSDEFAMGLVNWIATNVCGVLERSEPTGDEEPRRRAK